MTQPDLRGWLPVAIGKHPAEPVVEWLRAGSRRFTEPFFEDTVRALMREPFHQAFRHQTSLHAMLEFHDRCLGLAPAGFIFHMSRCGSTLVSRMLAALPEHLVLSEPPPLDTLLRTGRHGATDEQRIARLRAWMSAISQPRNGEQRLFVKLDAWHIFDLPILRRAFPDTPWVFLCRNPVEVLVSAMRTPGLHLTQGLIKTAMPEIAPANGPRLPPAEYAARVLAEILRAALGYIVPHGGGAIDYTRLPGAVFTDLAPRFGLSLTTEQQALMRAASAGDAKNSQVNFEPDSQHKQQQAGPAIRDLCAAYLDGPYQQLRALETGCLSGVTPEVLRP